MNGIPATAFTSCTIRTLGFTLHSTEKHPQSVLSESPITEKDQESEYIHTPTKCGSETILKNVICVLDESVTSDTLESHDLDVIYD